MKKLLTLLAVTIAISLPIFAQRKATAKVPAKTLAQKPTNTIPANRRDTSSDTSYTMTIERNGEKTILSSDQFEERDGNTIMAGGGRLLLFYAVRNNSNDQRFSFNASIPAPKKGVFPIVEEDQSPGFSITTSAFPKSGAIKGKTGSIEITAMPAGEGFVEGKFSGVCEVKMDDAPAETFKVSGSFRLRKRLE